nr:hypothetical protein [Tanacetum cinerariifolium]
MACSVPHTYDEIKCMVEKQIQEDRGRQLAIMNLGHQYGDAIEAKDELLKAYKQCRDISMDKRAMIEKLLKIESDLHYEMHSALFRKAKNFEKQIRDKLVREVVQSNYVCVVPDAYAFRLPPLVLLSFQISGSPYESFEMLPYYCYNLERKNEGTETRNKIDEKDVFEMLFIALGASVRTFVNYLRPLAIIDATYLKGQYKGTNLMAVGMDGNNQIMPIAFGDNPSLLFISDRHAAIALAVQKEFLLAYHVDIQPDAYDKLCQVGPQRWSRAHCPLVHYNYLTSNSVKSVNASTVVYRKLPVLKLAETYHVMVQEWYYKRRKLAENMTYEITD